MMMNSRSNDWAERIKGVELLDEIEKRLYDKKVNMLVGDDNNNPFCFAGFSLTRNYSSSFFVEYQLRRR